MTDRQKWWERIRLTGLCALLALSGCVDIQTAGLVQRGRTQLMNGDPKVALADFQSAAEVDPKYVANFTPLDEGVWTYVGRAYYETGDLAQARQSFQRALTYRPEDPLAQLYLGLVLVRDGNRETGLKEIESGLHGLTNFLDDIQTYDEDGVYWDPSGQIRSEIQKVLSMISSGDFSSQDLIARGEGIGKSMEEEADSARLYRERHRHDPIFHS